ncbi:efflux RND transporter periplasmic adaptor subunit [Marinicellulosiphila megalodicopiae]|uniref:efflux RND transporter periplasmic adaptor subunit n=1 Tax=Marinicellulosiphila megalodicopiae TaxID=2724896 RepID=UPI003BAF9B23
MTTHSTAPKPSIFRRFLPLWLILIALAIITVVAKTGGKPPVAQVSADKPNQAAYVTTATIKPGSYAPSLSLYGTLKADNQVNVIAKASGKVSSVNVKNAQRVNKGDVLLTIENADLQFQLDAARANLDDIQAKIDAQNIQYKSDVNALKIEQSLLDINEKSLSRQQALVKDGLASQSDLESAQRALQSQKLQLNNRELTVEKHASTINQLNASKKQIQSTFNQLQNSVNDLTIKADFSGVVNQLNIKTFEEVSLNQSLLTLVNQSALLVETYAAVNSLSFADLNIGSTAIGKIDDIKINLTLTSFDQVAKQGAIKLTFSAMNQTDLAVNRYMNVQLPLKSIDNIYSVPVHTVYSNNRIYAVLNDKLNRINIEVLGKQDNNLLIKIINSDSITTSEFNLLTTRLNDAINGLEVNVVESK